MIILIRKTHQTPRHYRDGNTYDAVVIHKISPPAGGDT